MLSASPVHAADAPAAKKPAEKPTPAAKAKPAAAAAAAKDDLTLPAPRDPAVESILENNPQTPAELARAAHLLSDLKRPDLAKKMLAKLIAAKPDEAKLADLAERFGSQMIADFALRADLAPEGKQVAAAIRAAAAKRSQEPKRIEQFVKQLADADEAVRVKAVAGVIGAGSSAIEPLLAVLADAKQADLHAPARSALAQLRGVAQGPLVAALDADQAQLVHQALLALAEMNARDAAVWMLAPLVAPKSDEQVKSAARTAIGRLLGAEPDADAACQLLVARAEEFFRRRQNVPGEFEDRVDVWRWDSGAKRPVREELRAEDAGRLWALRLARQAFRIKPAAPAVRRLYLASLLEEEAYRLGRDKLPAAATPGESEAAKFDRPVLEDLLLYTMAERHPAAATLVVRALVRKGDAPSLLVRTEGLSPLVTAARHSDRRLRLAALQSIVQLGAKTPYPGSSFVPEALAYYAASKASRRVLLAAPSAEAALAYSGDLAALGYEIDVARSGREAVQMAVNSPDYEFALIEAGIDRPAVDFVLQELRRDCRTAAMPVAIVARENLADRAEHVARANPMTLAVARPHTAAALRWQVRQLGALAGRDFMPVEVRTKQAVEALDLLTTLTGAAPHLYDVRQFQNQLLAAVYVPALAAKAVPLAGKLGTPESQRTLVDLASLNAQPIQLRQAAAAAFDQSARKQGVLLTINEIKRQFDRYNAGEKLDKQTQAVLGAILDSIEFPSQAARIKAARIKATVEKTKEKTSGPSPKAP